MNHREFTPEDYIAMLRRRWPLIVILAIVGAPLAYGVSRFLPNRYQSQALILVEQPVVSPEYVRPVGNSDLNERLTTMEQQILSQTRLEPIIRQLYPEAVNRISMEDLAAQLRKSIELTPVRPMQESERPSLPGFYVKVTMSNPRTAQEVCTAVTSMFIDESARRRHEQSEDTNQFLAQQIAEAKAKLDELDAKVAAFQSRHIGFLPEQEPANLNVLSGLTAELDATTQAIIRAQQDKNLAESMLTQQIAARRASETGKNPQTFADQLAALQTQLATLQARYTDDYPDVIKTKTEIEAIKAKMAESEGQIKGEAPGQGGTGPLEPLQFTQLRAQIRTDDQIISDKSKRQERIQEEIRQYQARIQSSPEVAQQYKEITRDHQTALDIYNNLLKKRAESVMSSDLERRQQGEQFRLLDPANLPKEALFPNRPLFALGGFGGGLALGLGLAFLLELRDTSLRTERDVQFSLRLPVIAVIPAIEPLSGKNLKQPATQIPAGSGIGAGARA